VFDDVSIQSAGGSGRFAEHYRLLGIVRGRESAVDLRVFRYPQRGRTRFVDRLSAALERWEGLADDGIVQCYDWGTDPRPWVAVEHTGSTLADRGRADLDVALASAIRCVGTVATLHANDVVHGGLEPRSVAYTEEPDEAASQSPPMIDDIGVLEAFRYPFDPSAMLDPRFAAPEYFDASYGAVDHATDIYQLGAVCYRLFTGRPPYDVPPEAARERVLGGAPPSPSSAVETLPGLLDGVVEKAMAKQKLTRYESAAQMEQDLLQVRDQLVHDG
jgi:serine/threonine protein kinase